MPFARQMRPLLAAPLLIAVAACAWAPGRAKWVDARPVQTGAVEVSAVDRGYRAAAAAIERGDYAEALDQLQIARLHAANDIRILNAFGVVYDKLGRFDLSARYYAEAKALDPSSAIVNNNIAFSAAMQERATAMAKMAEAGSSSPPLKAARQPAPRASASGGMVLRIQAPARAPTATTLVATTGRALVVINASGRGGGADAVRTELARLGWSAPKSALRDAPREPVTTIRYSKDAVVAARALARTLPASTRLVACDGDCKGVSLTVGVDVDTWRAHGRYGRS